MHDLTRSRTLALALTRTRTITRTLTRCAQSPCTIKDLPAGTNALVKVNAWGQAGEGEPSEYVAAQVGARVWLRIRVRIRIRIRIRVKARTLDWAKIRV